MADMYKFNINPIHDIVIQSLWENSKRNMWVLHEDKQHVIEGLGKMQGPHVEDTMLPKGQSSKLNYECHTISLKISVEVWYR